jgi:hypothetical protein
MTRDFRHVTSHELRSIRTVLSWAKTAHDQIGYSDCHTAEELDQMRKDLELAVNHLEKYTGPRKSWHQSLREERDAAAAKG